MTIRYQADADFDKRVVRAVRRRESTIDFQLASEARSGLGLEGIPDDQVLAIAAQEKRILITHDRRTMPAHFANFIGMSESPGVLIISQKMPLSVAVEHLITIWAASEAEEYINQIVPLQ